MDAGPAERRTELLTALNDLLDRQSVMNLYYNYDNLSNWNIFERFMEVLNKIVEDAVPKETDVGRKPIVAQGPVRVSRVLQASLHVAAGQGQPAHHGRPLARRHSGF